MFKAIKNLYQHGKLTKAGVGDKVEKGFITPEQYEAITGDLYTAE